jgi:hypothetical protein
MTATAPPQPISAQPSPITAIGDSVMLGAAEDLRRALGNVDIDADISRQAESAIIVLRTRRNAGRLGSTVILHIGNNGYLSTQQFDEMMQLLADVHRVIVVTLKVPRPWEGANNAVLAASVQHYANAVLVDWHAAAVSEPGLIYEDGVHLEPLGMQVYTDLIVAQVNAP